MRYRLMKDDDGHTYLIPVGKEQEFKKWVLDMENGEESGYDFEPERLLYHPSTYTFADVKVERF